MALLARDSSKHLQTFLWGSPYADDNMAIKRMVLPIAELISAPELTTIRRLLIE